jgi:hypothetical protein
MDVHRLQACDSLYHDTLPGRETPWRHNRSNNTLG